MKKILYSALLGSALLGSNASQAAVIDFDSDKSFHLSSGHYQEDGFQINSLSDFVFYGNYYSGDVYYPAVAGRNPDPDGNTLGSYGGVILSKIDGSLFDFNSIDLTDGDNSSDGFAYYQVGLVHGVQFDFLFGDSSTTSTVIKLDDTPGLETFTFNYQGLSQVSWRSIVNSTMFDIPVRYEGYVQADNIVVNSSVAPVPVPAAVWLFGSGVVGLLGFNRKRSRSLAA